MNLKINYNSFINTSYSSMWWGWCDNKRTVVANKQKTIYLFVSSVVLHHNLWRMHTLSSHPLSSIIVTCLLHNTAPNLEWIRKLQGQRRQVILLLLYLAVVCSIMDYGTIDSRKRCCHSKNNTKFWLIKMAG